MNTNTLRLVINSFIAVVVLLGGAVAAIELIVTKPAAASYDNSFTAVPEVEVMAAAQRLLAAPIVGYGNVRPKNQINIIPEVNGKLIKAHKNLAQGNIIPEGELLFEIDDTVYKARMHQAQAEVRSLEAALLRHDQEQRNLSERIANLEEMAGIGLRDYKTSKTLYEVDNVGTSRDIDLVHQKYLKQNDALVGVKNRAAMIPLLRLETLAQLDAARARLDQAMHDLENTKIFCPFRARVESVVAQESQVVTAHFSIATLTDMEAFEISVSVDPRDLAWLDQSIQPAALELADKPTGPPVAIRWSSPHKKFTWQGHVSRFERMDETTRTARLVVEVHDIDMKATIGVGDDHRPSLSIGMYCRADLPAAQLSKAMLVPRHAIYDNRFVYVVELEGDSTTGTLARRQVTLLRSIGDEVLVDHKGRSKSDICELLPNEFVVTSPLVRPIVGMKVSLRDDMLAKAKTAPARPIISRVRLVSQTN